MSVFDVDFSSTGLPKYLVPVRLRQSKMLAWLQALVSPVSYLYGLFGINRKNNLYDLSRNGQVCYLQAALNDVFDATYRRIFITDEVTINTHPVHFTTLSNAITTYNRSIVLGLTCDHARSATGTRVKIYRKHPAIWLF